MKSALVSLNFLPSIAQRCLFVKNVQVFTENIFLESWKEHYSHFQQ